MNVSTFLLEGKDPERTALEFPDSSCSYGELRVLVERVATAISAMSGVTGDRILLLDDNSLFWVASYLGIMRAGRVAVPLSPHLGGETLACVLRSTGAKVVFTNGTIARREQERLAYVCVITEIPGPGCGEADPDPGSEPNDLAALMFTSGSTSEPRGVMVTHRNIVANTESIIESLGLNGTDRMMVVLPFHYCFGSSLLHTHLAVHGTLVMDSRFMYPEVVIERMIASRCTGFAGVPSHFRILLRKSTMTSRRFPSLRHIQQAGGPLPVADVMALRRALPDTRIFVMYGQTEATARLSCLPPIFLDTKADSVGVAIPGVQLTVVSRSGGELLPGQVGEIVARGDNITLGYWNAPDETANSFRDGALYTGDLGTIDEDGFVYIAGRSRDFLKVRGERVSCRSIEEKLLDLDEVIEAAVVGMTDEVLGEAVKAFVVPGRPGSAGFEERCLGYCKMRFPAHLVPREIVVLPELPRNSAGKIIKSKLNALPRNPAACSPNLL